MSNSIDYNDDRFKQVETDKAAAMQDVNNTYDSIINNSDQYFDKQVEATENWGKQQQQLQQEQTDFTIEQIEQQKDQSYKDYQKEKSAAYVDWQKQSNQFSANAEQMAASGLMNSGYSESSQVRMYNTYQNRVATARESYNKAVLNYNNAIKDARLQNNSALAEIAYNTLQTSLELSLQGFQYKNNLVQAKANAKREVDNTYWSRYQDTWNQIYQENAMAEQIREFNEQQALERDKMKQTDEHFNKDLSFREKEHGDNVQLKKDQMAQEDEHFNKDQAYKYDVLDFDKQKQAEDKAYKYDVLDFDKQVHADDKQYKYDTLDFNKQVHADDKQYKYDTLDFNKQVHADDKRHNSDVLKETTRHNKANESYQNNTLNETIRSNKADEKYKTNVLEWEKSQAGVKTSSSGGGKSSGSSGGKKSSSGSSGSAKNTKTTTSSGNKGGTGGKIPATTKTSVKNTANKSYSSNISKGNTSNANKKIKSLATMSGQTGSKTAIANSIVAYASMGQINTNEAAYMLNYFGYDVSKYLK